MSGRMQRRLRKRQQVQAVRARLTPRPPRTSWRTTVQANDGTQFRFDAAFALHAGEFVEVAADGALHVANLPNGNRVVGVVVSCELECWENVSELKDIHL